MSQSRGDTGQSMEEILASIRRIIAEGERDAREAGGPRTGSGASGPHERPGESDPASSGAADTDVLVLTEMIREDGSIVSLQALEPAEAQSRSDDETPPADTVAEHPPVPSWLAPDAGSGSGSSSDGAEPRPEDQPESPAPAEETMTVPIVE